MEPQRERSFGLLLNATAWLEDDQLLRQYETNFEEAKRELKDRLLRDPSVGTKKSSQNWDAVFLIIASLLPFYFSVTLSWVVQNGFNWAGLPFLFPIFLLLYYIVYMLYTKICYVNRGLGGFVSKWGMTILSVVGFPILLACASVVALMKKDFNVIYSSTLFALSVFPFGMWLVVVPIVGIFASGVWYLIERRREKPNYAHSAVAGLLICLLLSVWVSGCSMAFFVLLAEHKWGVDHGSGLPSWDSVFIPIWIFDAITILLVSLMILHSNKSGNWNGVKKWSIMLIICFLLLGFQVLMWAKLQQNINASFITLFIPADIAALIITVWGIFSTVRKYWWRPYLLKREDEALLRS
eukprot:TRINITY_DN3653_c0_g1_i1.p1 TRINITY_DN3653_c0_g1~~TRINITY_DN3653_c0_g1_i1.p1  ORF type:complete len:367 (+),score=53.53 TRINITY_DN3653_c0_g1_i1:45-1103(+)